jgi:hypothetical protein
MAADVLFQSIGDRWQNASSFNIASTAECECGVRVQTEEYIFWNCKRYEEQRATMRDLLSENSKKNTQSQLQSS